MIEGEMKVRSIAEDLCPGRVIKVGEPSFRQVKEASTAEENSNSPSPSEGSSLHSEWCALKSPNKITWEKERQKENKASYSFEEREPSRPPPEPPIGSRGSRGPRGGGPGEPAEQAERVEEEGGITEPPEEPPNPDEEEDKTPEYKREGRESREIKSPPSGEGEPGETPPQTAEDGSPSETGTRPRTQEATSEREYSEEKSEALCGPPQLIQIRALPLLEQAPSSPCLASLQSIHRAWPLR
ncbi:fibrous sheath CABYR-binding protein-like [Camponotus floridanus]|uniref:fibrous sheath CABYR-binding protein-like n=1 Tax=Camponotus floridanus TaxID=104421 RepID=UPI000DC68075|nr:fibrous sheath CABYR-binding protein-like [Camponotus floridanus]